MNDRIVELSEAKNQIIINIIYTISKSDRWYSLKEISSVINLSDRSSQRYINQLYDVITEYNDTKEIHFSLLMKKNYGVKLLISDHANIDFLVTHILQSDTNVKVLVALIFQSYENINDYAEKNFLAKYHIEQSCRRCNDLLSLFYLEIDKKNFKINGAESNTRIFIHQFCWVLYKYDVWPEPFKSIDYNSIESDILYITESLNIPVTNPIKKKSLMFNLTISLIRHYQKNPVILTNRIKRNIPTYSNESDSPVLTDIVGKVFDNHSINNSDEIYFFILHLLFGSTVYKSPYMRKKILDYHQKINSDIFQATILFFDFFQKKIADIPLKDLDSSFEFIFRTHLKAAIYPELSIDFEEGYFSNDMMTNYQIHSSEMLKLINEMKDKKDLPLFKETNYLSQRYMMLILSLNLLMIFNEPIKIKLNTDYSNLYEKFIKKFICDYFKYDYKLIFIDNTHFQKADLIISSLPESNLKEEVINITYPISDRELNKIQEKLDFLESRI